MVWEMHGIRFIRVFVAKGLMFYANHSSFWIPVINTLVHSENCIDVYRKWGEKMTHYIKIGEVPKS